jgi:RHS Repeat
MLLDLQKPNRRKSQRLASIGISCLESKRALPSDIESAAFSTLVQGDFSGRDAVIVPDGPVTAGHAANIPGPEPGYGFLRSCLDNGILCQGTIPEGLMGSLGIVVMNKVPQHPAQSSIVEKPEATCALSLGREHPALGESIAIGTLGRGGYRGDAGLLQDMRPMFAELRVTIMDQVAAADLLEPASAFHGHVASDLHHERLIAMLRDAQDLDLAGAQVDGEEDIVGPLDQSAPTHGPGIDGEEVGGNESIGLLGHEALPAPVGGSSRGRLESMPGEDGSDGARREGDQAEDQHPGDPQLPPGGVLCGHAQDYLLNVSRHAWTTDAATLDAQQALPAQPFPALDGLGLGDGGNLCQPLPAHCRTGAGEAQTPFISKGKALPRRHPCMQVRDLIIQMGNLGPEELVLPGNDRRSDQSDKECDVVHRDAEGGHAPRDGNQVGEARLVKGLLWHVPAGPSRACFEYGGYTYDGLYRVVTETRSTNGQATYVVASGYDAVGNRTQVTYPGTGRQVTSTYDRAHRLVQVKDVSGTRRSAL